MIEKILYDYLTSALDVPVYAEEPEKPPKRYVRYEKTGAGSTDHISRSVIAVQSYGSSLLDTAEISHAAVTAMESIAELPEICGCWLNTENNFTDTATNRHRYQAVFEITHY